MSYSKDLRKRVVEFVIKENNSMKSASKIFDINYSTVKEWVKIFKETERFLKKPFVENNPQK